MEFIERCGYNLLRSIKSSNRWPIQEYMQDFQQATQEYCCIPLPHSIALKLLADHSVHWAKHVLGKNHWWRALFGKRWKGCREKCFYFLQQYLAKYIKSQGRNYLFKHLWWFLPSLRRPPSAAQYNLSPKMSSLKLKWITYLNIWGVFSFFQY